MDGGQRPKPKDKRYVHLDLRLTGYKDAFYKRLLQFQCEARSIFEYVVLAEQYLGRCGYLLADLDTTGTKTRKAARIGEEKKQNAKRQSASKTCLGKNVTGKEKDDIIDLDSSQGSQDLLQEDFWIKSHLYNLNKRVEQILISPTGWLIDDHMFAAQKLMSVKLALKPEEEIQSTLLPQLLGRGFKPVKRFYVQVHNISYGGGHWLLSKLDWKKKEVQLFDSLSITPLPVDLIRQLHQLYGHMASCDDKKLSISVVTVQQQSNTNDCGLFAIANGFEVVSGGDPGLCFYDCAVMRKHFTSVLVAQDLVPFPKDGKRKPRDRVMLTKIMI